MYCRLNGDVVDQMELALFLIPDPNEAARPTHGTTVERIRIHRDADPVRHAVDQRISHLLRTNEIRAGIASRDNHNKADSAIDNHPPRTLNRVILTSFLFLLSWWAERRCSALSDGSIDRPDTPPWRARASRPCVRVRTA